jgi:hypothetical protein
MSLAAFGSSNITQLGNSSCVNSTAENVFNGSATQGDILEIFSLSLPTGNQTYYNEFIDTTWPLIFTAWPKNFGATSVPVTRIVCLRADNIVAGSVVPSGAVCASHAGLGMALVFGVLAAAVVSWSLFRKVFANNGMLSAEQQCYVDLAVVAIIYH